MQETLSLINSPIYLLLSLHCLIGMLAAYIAFEKGYLLRFWLIIGLIGGTFALIVALRLQQKVK